MRKKLGIGFSVLALDLQLKHEISDHKCGWFIYYFFATTSAPSWMQSSLDNVMTSPYTNAFLYPQTPLKMKTKKQRTALEMRDKTDMPGTDMTLLIPWWETLPINVL